MEVVQARAGRPFTIALERAVDAAKTGDPLHPVTVVVPSNLAGLSLRRLLGSGQLRDRTDGAPTGIANVSFATPFQLASRLAAPALAARGARPLTTAVLAAAVRHILTVDPGRFGAVADHLATETALVRAYGELTELEPDQFDVLERDGVDRTRDLVRFVRAIGTYLESGAGHTYHDENAVLRAATVALQSGSGPEEHLVLAGPFGQGPATISFLERLAALPRSSGLIALTGDAVVDADTMRQTSVIAGHRVGAEAVAAGLPTVLIPAADSDEEVRAVVREVLALAAAGHRFDRMAVFHPSTDSYARTIREQFDLAAVPTAGAEFRRLGHSMTGRLVHRLLELARGTAHGSDRRFERRNVLALIEAAPLRGQDGSSLNSGSWEVVSRRAGVVGGIDDWDQKLERHAAQAHAAATDPVNEERGRGFIESQERDARAATEMREFVLWLYAQTAGASIPDSWAGRCKWLGELVAALLPPANRRSHWPEIEVDAAERIDAVLARIGVLDDVAPGASWPAFVRAIDLELDAPMGRRGRFGTGVLVAPMASAAGLDLDHVFVLGLSEGICPRSIREDTLLPDRERDLVAGALPRRADRLTEERRRFLYAVESATLGCTLVMPMGDHRNGRTRTASRWWVEAIQKLEGGPHRSTENWMEADLACLREPASFVQALDDGIDRGLATSRADIDLQLVRRGHADGVGGDLARRLSMLVERRSGFNRFTGDLSGEAVPEVGRETAISATRLETWAGCPRRYFFSQLLGLGQLDAPDRIEEISPLDRGSMLHAILERFIGDVLPDQPGGPITADTSWEAEDRKRLGDAASQIFGEFEDMGKTGRPLLWGIQRELIDNELDRFLAADTDLRRNRQSRPDQVEMAIGFASEPGGEPTPPALVELPDGRVLRLRGFADRVDLRADGSPLVLDYKTGKAYTKSHFEDDPVVAGTRLQLGVYAEAARQRYGTELAGAYYWFTSERGGFRTIGYEWTAERRERFGDAVLSIVTGIERGLFPPNPGDYGDYFGKFSNCRFCEFDRICSRDRGVEHDQAAASGRIEPLLALSVQTGEGE